MCCEYSSVRPMVWIKKILNRNEYNSVKFCGYFIDGKVLSKLAYLCKVFVYLIRWGLAFTQVYG